MHADSEMQLINDGYGHARGSDFMQHISCAVSSPLYQTNYCCQSEACWVYKAFALRITTSLGLSSPLLQFSTRMAADSTMRSEVEELQKRANQVTDEVMPPTITKVAKFNIDLRGSSADGVFFLSCFDETAHQQAYSDDIKHFPFSVIPLVHSIQDDDAKHITCTCSIIMIPTVMKSDKS